MPVRGSNPASVPPDPGHAASNARVRCVVWCPPDQNAPESLVRALEARSLRPRLAWSHWSALAHLIATGEIADAARMLILVSASRLEHVDEVAAWMRMSGSAVKTWVFDPADSPPLRAYVPVPVKPTVVVGAMIERLPRGYRFDGDARADAPAAAAAPANGSGSPPRGSPARGLRLVGEPAEKTPSAAMPQPMPAANVGQGANAAAAASDPHANGRNGGHSGASPAVRPPLVENGSQNDGLSIGDDVLTAEELRMLLHGEHPDDRGRSTR